MGNIITQTEQDIKSYEVNDNGDFTIKQNFNANTGTFNNIVYFKDDVKIVDGKTIDGVDLSGLNTEFTTLRNQVSSLTSGAGAGTFTGAVTATSFTGASGEFTSIKTSNLDVNGNIISSTGANFTVPLKGTSGNFTDGLTVDGNSVFSGSLSSNGLSSTTGNFSGLLTANSGLSGPFGTLSSDGISSSAGVFTGSLSANGATFSTLSAKSGNFTDGLTGPFGTLSSTGISSSDGLFSGLLTASGLSSTTGTFSGQLSANGGLTGPFGTLSSTGISSSAGIFSGSLSSNGLSSTTGTFSGQLSANGGLTGPFGTLSSTGISSSAGIFSGLLTANGGLTLPTNTQLTLNGSITGSGNINLGPTLQINQGTNAPTYSSTGSAMTGNNGLIIRGQTNKWSIGEVKGRNNANPRLCFSLNDVPFACIDPTGNKNLVAGNPWV